MKHLPAFPTAIALLTLVASCATQAPPPAPAGAPAVPIPPPPAGSQRLPGSVTCETEVSCYECADDHDRELVRFGFLVHAADVHGCYDRVAAAHPGIEGRVVFRVGIDPTGAVGSSCVVRSSMNDAALDSCLADVITTWKFSPPKSGGWALVDYTHVFGKPAKR